MSKKKEFCDKCGTRRIVYGKKRDRRVCPKCHNERARKNYTNNEKARSRIREYGKKRRLENLEEIRAKDRDRYLIRRYGVSPEKYSDMFLSQGGVCAICGCSPNGKKLGVDHNHKTGRVRKLLCDRCNVSLGLLEESIDIMEKMIEYTKLECINES